MQAIGRGAHPGEVVPSIGEILAEIVLFVLNLTLRLGLAAMTYWLWLGLRRRLWGLDPTVLVETPDGLSYSLKVPHRWTCQQFAQLIQ